MLALCPAPCNESRSAAATFARGTHDEDRIIEDRTGAPKSERFAAHDEAAKDNPDRKLVGRGPTRMAAIRDLLELLEEHQA